MGASFLVCFTKIAPSLILPRGEKGKLEAYTTSLPSFSARSAGNPAFLRTCSVDNKLDLRAKLEDDSRLEVEFIKLNYIYPEDDVARFTTSSIMEGVFLIKTEIRLWNKIFFCGRIYVYTLEWIVAKSV